MSVATKQIVKSYSSLFDGLDSITKLELIESLSRSIKRDKGKGEEAFFKSFGAFASDIPAEEFVQEIRASRSFRKKDIKL